MAVQQALDVGMVHTEERLAHLAGLVRSGLARVPGVTVRDRGRRLCAICSFTKVGFLLVPVIAYLPRRWQTNIAPCLGASRASDKGDGSIPSTCQILRQCHGQDSLLRLLLHGNHGRTA